MKIIFGLIAAFIVLAVLNPFAANLVAGALPALLVLCLVGYGVYKLVAWLSTKGD